MKRIVINTLLLLSLFLLSACPEKPIHHVKLQSNKIIIEDFLEGKWDLSYRTKTTERTNKEGFFEIKKKDNYWAYTQFVLGGERSPHKGGLTLHKFNRNYYELPTF